MVDTKVVAKAPTRFLVAGMGMPYPHILKHAQHTIHILGLMLVCQWVQEGLTPAASGICSFGHGKTLLGKPPGRWVKSEISL